MRDPSVVEVEATVDARSLVGGPRPRMVFFRPTDQRLPDFVLGNLADHVRCLEQFFDISVVTEDADYDEVVDRVRPDIALFESGVYARQRRSIRNTHRHPEIPKLGFLDADAYCLTRSVFLSDMDDWGVESFVTIATSAAGYSPDLAERTICWPNFADRRVFRSYPDRGSTPILLSGSRATNYPWRVQVDRLLGERFAVEVAAHGGWFSREAAALMPVGEAYARSLSSALIVPTCGTIAAELVRKHFEIPASGALLVTERTAAVEAAGFVDMENCVFADPSDVVDKVEYLLAHRDELQAIAAAGQALAHEHHSIEHRDQIRQWFELQRRRSAGERIVQPDLFGPLVLERTVDARSSASPIGTAGIDRILLTEAFDLLDEDPVSAADRFARVLNLHFEPEAALGIARAWLAVGQPDWAKRMLEYSTGVVIGPHGASRPDPVEWAWLIRTALCQGRHHEARDLAGRFPGMRHPELDRIRRVVAGITGTGASFADRPLTLTVHRTVADEPWARWCGTVETDLIANGQVELAARLRLLPEPADPAQAVPSSPTISDGLGVTGRRMVRFARRVRGRVAREYARLLGRVPARSDASVFQVFGGRQADAVVALLIDARTAEALERLVGRDPAQLTLIRIGRTDPLVDPVRFEPRGLNSGLGADLIARMPLFGTTIVVTGAAGAAHLSAASLGATAILVLIADADPGELERELAATPRWRQGDAELVSRASSALGSPVRVWEQEA